MKHIYNKLLRGYIQMEKGSFGDLSELARISPNTLRILLCIYQYSDLENELITDMYTIGKVLNISTEEVTNSVKYLFDNDYIEVERVELDDYKDIYVYLDDNDVYKNAKCYIWNYIDNELVEKYDKEWTYNKIIVNTGIVRCSNNRMSNILIDYRNNEMYSDDNNKETV